MPDPGFDASDFSVAPAGGATPVQEAPVAGGGGGGDDVGDGVILLITVLIMGVYYLLTGKTWW